MPSHQLSQNPNVFVIHHLPQNDTQTRLPQPTANEIISASLTQPFHESNILQNPSLDTELMQCQPRQNDNGGQYPQQCTDSQPRPVDSRIGQRRTQGVDYQVRDMSLGRQGWHIDDLSIGASHPTTTATATGEKHGRLRSGTPAGQPQ